MDKEYILDFTIPQGPTGPTGPAGPNNENAVGLAWNFRPMNSTFLANNAPLSILLDAVSAGLNVKYYQDGLIGIITGGSYRIDYYMSLQVPSASPENVVKVTVNPIYNNQQENTYSVATLNIDNNSLYYFSGTTINNFNPDDLISLIVKADKAVPFSYIKSYLLVTRIGEPLVRIPYSD